MPINKTFITGLVLAGGRGSRMGGVDKGLMPFDGKPLVQHALDRLRPQVGPLLINANRNPEAYAAFGMPVVADALADYPGPLGGMLAGLRVCTTPYLVTVPCDTPRFPIDLVTRLASAIDTEGADVAVAATQEADGSIQVQPVFCLLKSSLQHSLESFLQGGQRKIERWTGTLRRVQVLFHNHDAFFNANTLDDLARLSTFPQPIRRPE